MEDREGDDLMGRARFQDLKDPKPQKEATHAVWTDEAVEMLRELVAEGLPFSDIASRLPIMVSRNAVIGKAKRLGLEKPVKVGGKKVERSLSGREKRLKNARAAAVARAPAASPTETPEPFNGGVTLDELRPGQCRFPIGDPSDPGFRFCGAKAVGPYCEAHRSLCFRRSPNQGESGDG